MNLGSAPRGRRRGAKRRSEAAGGAGVRSASASKLGIPSRLFSRYVVGWAISHTIDRHLALAALQMANEQRRPEAGLLHHTDRGCQYASDDYQLALGAEGFICSMSRTGDCYDNAVVESFFGTLKAELGDTFDSREHASRALFDYLEVFYNRARRPSSPGYISPAQHEKTFLPPQLPNQPVR